MEICPICEEPLDDTRPTVVLGDKGSEGVNNASLERGSHIRTQKGQTVHTVCRSRHTNKNLIEREKKRKSASATQETCKRRSESPMFSYNEHCLFCGTLVNLLDRKYDNRHGKSYGDDVYPVRTSDLQDSILRICSLRNDEWATTVADRINFARDLHAVDAIYHQKCSVNFRTGKNPPLKYSGHDQCVKRPKIGRPIDKERTVAFLNVVYYLEENDDEQITISDLIAKMAEYLSGSDTGAEPYSFKYMKQKLNEYFGDKLIITELNGKANVVTFRSTASSILQSFHKAQEACNPHSEVKWIIETAAKLIQSDIKSLDTAGDTYPTKDQMTVEQGLEYIPDSLIAFLQILFTGKENGLKLVSVGQAVMQATRPPKPQQIDQEIEETGVNFL